MANLRTAWPRDFAQATELPAEAVGELIEALIAELDRRDGDPDEEDDDPAGDPLDAGEDEDWRPGGIATLRPVYAIDQTRGPINESEAVRDWHDRMQRV